MANLLRKLLLLKKPPPPRLLASVDKPHFLDSFPRQDPVQRSPLPDVSAGGAPPPSLRPSLQVFPAFSLSFLVDPIGAPLRAGSDAELDGGGDRTPVWADSVKKKRKRKMNKHKYRKLRKRLRRKTK